MRSGDTTDTAGGGGDPYKIDGYQHIRTIGAPAVPNEPIDAVTGPDGRLYVADLGLNRILAYTPEGELDTAWGDDGMSSRVEFPARLAVGPEGEIYAIELLSATIHIFDESGQERPARRIPREPDPNAHLGCPNRHSS